MNNYIEIVDDDDDGFDVCEAPFDLEVNCCKIYVHGTDLSGMKLRGKCEYIWFSVENYNEVDLSGFMELEIESVYVNHAKTGLLKLLELKCKTVWCLDEKIEEIMNKYVQEEPDPLMRDIQGCKYELAINGYKDLI